MSEYGYTPVRLTLTQAMEIFAEHLDQIAEDLASNILYDLSQLPKIPDDADEMTRWVYEEMIALQKKEIITTRTKVIQRIKSRHQQPVFGRITDADIERAKQVPISDLYVGRLYKDKTGRCPFHEERTPSFHIFKDNRFKCFGCQAHGSAIDFYMKMNNVDFISAVKQLIRL